MTVAATVVWACLARACGFGWLADSGVALRPPVAASGGVRFAAGARRRA